jgi:hypothetical protein
MDCSHPADRRWQYDGHWMCCTCGRYFWGAKSETPPTDYCGRPTFTAAPLAPEATR